MWNFNFGLSVSAGTNAINMFFSHYLWQKKICEQSLPLEIEGKRFSFLFCQKHRLFSPISLWKIGRIALNVFTLREQNIVIRIIGSQTINWISDEKIKRIKLWTWTLIDRPLMGFRVADTILLFILMIQFKIESKIFI